MSMDMGFIDESIDMNSTTLGAYYDRVYAWKVTSKIKSIENRVKRIFLNVNDDRKGSCHVVTNFSRYLFLRMLTPHNQSIFYNIACKRNY